jgi:hypothetical protein
LASSKCDPFKKGVQINIFENIVFNPVKNMADYLSIRVQSGANMSAPLFVKSEYDLTPLTRTTFLSLLGDSLGRLGYDTTKYSGHSFRI